MRKTLTSLAVVACSCVMLASCSSTETDNHTSHKHPPRLVMSPPRDVFDRQMEVANQQMHVDTGWGHYRHVTQQAEKWFGHKNYILGSCENNTCFVTDTIKSGTVTVDIDGNVGKFYPHVRQHFSKNHHQNLHKKNHYATMKTSPHKR